MREAELQKELEIKRADVLQQRERAEKLSSAIVEAEIVKCLADASLYQTKVEADGKLFEAQKKAEGLQLTFEAQASGIRKILEAFGGDNASLLQYLMLEKGLYIELAKANAEAIRGLEPKITVWNTGSGQEQDAGKSIRDIFQALPPLLSTINEQTGISAPTWLAQNPQQKHFNKSV